MADAQHLPQGRRQAGDRHLKFNETRDNLVIERARHVVVPFDSSKAGATDFARICSLDEVDTIVMDASVPEIEKLCLAHDIRLIVADD